MCLVSVQKQVARAFALMWHFAQPMLFGLIGAEIDSGILGESFVGENKICFFFFERRLSWCLSMNVITLGAQSLPFGIYS